MAPLPFQRAGNGWQAGLTGAGRLAHTGLDEVSDYD